MIVATTWIYTWMITEPIPSHAMLLLPCIVLEKYPLALPRDPSAIAGKFPLFAFCRNASSKVMAT
ncbi:hypothetical protein GHT06_010502 [Daphnia sinensis]|uniref:Uncharacterized protein n=1 Tax=Daphnia sinensis TaxID=1820382 RepID=A0AAD5LJ98_9CRUS|nr:hypothetical protein GHT06_010502 [Daphnia sinensis]